MYNEKNTMKLNIVTVNKYIIFVLQIQRLFNALQDIFEHRSLQICNQM